jgi:OPT family small oligopeptide transporter
MEHLNDPNFEFTEISSHPRLRYVYEGSDAGTESHYGSDRHLVSKTESLRTSTAIDFEDESSYPEVRAAVANVDDPSMPVNTFRMWFLGLFLTSFISCVNQIFATRNTSVLITAIVAQVAALPLGKGLEKILPTTRFRTFGHVWSFNPGPFNVKEHVCITVMSNVAAFGAYATDVVATQRVFYNQSPGFAYQIMLVLSIQILGYSLGGILRPFVVWPASMIWPGALVNCALFNTLHKNYGKRDHKHISRHKFFGIVLLCSFTWYWLPGYLFTALSMFNWICWIAPTNPTVNALFGTSSGLGLGILTFDWSMVSFIGSPLVTPWWSEINVTAAMILFLWIVTPIVFFTNTFFSKFMPISTFEIFDNTGMPYNASAIITNGEFDESKYLAYSPVFLPAARVVTFGTQFAAFTAIIVHTFLWYRRDIVRRFRGHLKDEPDVHSRLMQAYAEVPGWWYGLLGSVALIILISAIEVFPTKFPIWAALLAFAFATVFSIPIAMIAAMTNQQIGLNVIAEVIGGYLLPGRPVANMIFKALLYVTVMQAVSFSGQLKLGHYMKIPPRTMFAVQCVAVFVLCVVATGTQQWMFANVIDYCSADQPNGFICPDTFTFATSSLIWGGIGPQRTFGPGAMYSSILWFFLIGAVTPIPLYFLSRRYPLAFWRYVNMPIFFAGTSFIPPASGINYTMWAIVGFFFNFFMRRNHFRWWMRYNYILSAGLDAGVGLSLLVIFFCVQLPKGGATLNWWGNDVWQNTADAMGTPFYVLSPGATFGPPWP